MITRTRFYILGVALSILTISSVYLFGTSPLPRIEEFNYSLLPIYSAFQNDFANSFINSSFWFRNYGLGLSWPILHTLYPHPLSFLFSLIMPFQSFGVILLSHLILQSIVIWKISAELKFSLKLRTVVTITILFSSQLEYLTSSDAGAVFIGWTVLPVAILGVIRMHKKQFLLFDRNTIVNLLLFAFAISFGILNGHPGVYVVYIFSILIVLLLLKMPSIKSKFFFLLSGISLALLLSIDKIILSLQEYNKFSSYLPRVQYDYESTFQKTLWSLFMRPIPFSSPFQDVFFVDFVDENSFIRVLSFGSPFASMLIFSWIINFRKRKYSKDSIEVTLLFSFLFCFFCQFIPAKFLTEAVSASWTFRDPATLLGVIILGLALRDLEFGSNKPNFRFNIFLNLHIGVTLLSGAIILFGGNLIHGESRFTARDYDALISNFDRSEIGKILRKNLNCPDTSCNNMGSRVAISSNVSELLGNNQLKSSGLVLNLLGAVGYEEVNGVIKGNSLDLIHPSQRKFYSMITSERYRDFEFTEGGVDWISSDKSLRDLLGIRIVIFVHGEYVDKTGLRYIGSIATEDSSNRLLDLYLNKNSWSRYTQVDELPTQNLKDSAFCAKNSKVTTCQNFSINQLDLVPAKANFVMNNGHYKINIQRRLNTSFLVIGEMWDEKWKVKGGVLRNWNGIQVIEIPPNISEIEVLYDDMKNEFLIKLRQGSWLLFTMLFLLALQKRVVREN